VNYAFYERWVGVRYLLLCQPVAESVKWLGESPGFWVQTFVLFVSAVAALWLIKSSTKIEKRRATIDLVLHQQHDAAFQDARVWLNKMREEKMELSVFASKPDSAEYKHIMLVLNTHEFVASGIREGAFNEDTYKRMRYSTIRNDWKSLCAFIKDFRIIHDNRETLFQDFQWLNSKWEKSALASDR
jgi:hypothetical protein